MPRVTPRVVLAIAVTYLAVIVAVVVWHAVLGMDPWYFSRDCCSST